MSDLTPAALLACIDARWSPEIGDPTVMGWVTVALYLVSGLLCLRAGRVRHRDRRFWLALGVLLLFLCVNKQLDLQSALTATGRCMSQLQGWYDARKTVQFAFILGLLGVSGVMMLFLLYRLLDALPRIGLALTGLGLQVTFVAVRAVGFHHFDQIINMTIGDTRVNWILELSGLFLIAVNAGFAIAGRRELRERRRRRRQRAERLAAPPVYARQHDG